MHWGAVQPAFWMLMIFHAYGTWWFLMAIVTSTKTFFKIFKNHSPTIYSSQLLSKSRPDSMAMQAFGDERGVEAAEPQTDQTKVGWCATPHALPHMPMPTNASKMGFWWRTRRECFDQNKAFANILISSRIRNHSWSWSLFGIKSSIHKFERWSLKVGDPTLSVACCSFALLEFLVGTMPRTLLLGKGERLGYPCFEILPCITISYA